MASDDGPDELGDAGKRAEGTRTDGAREELRGARERLEEGAGEVAESFDQRAVDLLSWLLDTETRARIYVFLRQNPGSTSQEVADGTGLYPSTVREALAELHGDETVTRRKREAAGAGNNPYEYEAIAPSTLVEGVVEEVQSELNTVFNLDRHLGRDESDETEPVTISVETVDGDDASGGEPADDADATTDPDGAVDEEDEP
ncbi:winged helix-turn-helix transcriptional regulator [Halorarum halophilum]|uniref:Winged helix-turn-helix transcriptional regulator n=1 Tax=Halorarum halophilum TaxID=2743090 RepID=A0A7D5GYI7_9EURY|nr:winged helix-turn-helix domain-containing protein [Halobaculum halophilum]QLG26873.1 winged helix-turn-helix transcriptional regulator [Halobaculum halophilum]